MKRGKGPINCCNQDLSQCRSGKLLFRIRRALCLNAATGANDLTDLGKEHHKNLLDKSGQQPANSTRVRHMMAAHADLMAYGCSLLRSGDVWWMHTNLDIITEIFLRILHRNVTPANSMFNCEHGHRGPLSLCCSSANPDKLILYGESKEICYTRRFCEHDSFPEAHSNNILLIGDNLYVKG